MPKRLLKRFMPHAHHVKNHKHLRLFGKLIHDPNLWHLNRYSVSRAFAIGFFTMFLPLPFQMIVAAGLAIIGRANLPLSVALVWISNPFTMPAMFYFAYKVGTLILQVPAAPPNGGISFAWVLERIANIWPPLLLGSLVCAITSAGLGYLIIRLFWRYRIISHWRARQLRRAK